MPQLSQQLSRSSEEISTLTLALLWIHTRSEMASAAPNACSGPSTSNTQRHGAVTGVSSRVTQSVLTQQLPQEPWSRISFRVGQLGHCCLGSKVSGSSTSPAYCTLEERRQPLTLHTTTYPKENGATQRENKRTRASNRRPTERAVTVWCSW